MADTTTSTTAAPASTAAPCTSCTATAPPMSGPMPYSNSNMFWYILAFVLLIVVVYFVFWRNGSVGGSSEEPSGDWSDMHEL